MDFGMVPIRADDPPPRQFFYFWLHGAAIKRPGAQGPAAPFT
jgi:hypothetical protein